MRSTDERGQISGHSKYATKKDVRKTYLDARQTQSYLASLDAVERISINTRNQHMSKGLNPILELRRALKD